MGDRPVSGNGVLHAMTIDVEEHFQVSAFEGVVPREDWETLPSRVEANTERLLDLYDACGVRCTFFVLGWVAERYPELVRRIAERGHEIGSHGFSHRLIYNQTPEEFAAEAKRSRDFLREVSGQPVYGYRAASFSITRRSLWALDALVEAGYRYDSSVFPVLHDRYGVPGARKEIHRLKTPSGAELVEVPPSTMTLGKATLPVAGGGYLRIYPRMLTRWAVGNMDRARRPAIVYVHPWEVDPEQPRVRGASLKSRFRHYWGLKTTGPKLRELMQRHRFGTMQQVIEQTLGPLEGEVKTPARDYVPATGLRNPEPAAGDPAGA